MKRKHFEMADNSTEIILVKDSQQRKEDLFDEYERFRAIGNESIHDYFVRFHKLVNDMKITQLNIPTHQMNTSLSTRNLPAYWIYTHLKAYEPHAKKTLKKQEQSTSIVDPLAYVAHTTSAPALSSPSTPISTHNQQLRTLSNSGLMLTPVHDVTLLLEPFRRKAPGSGKDPRERWTAQYFKDKALQIEAKEKGDVLMLKLSMPR
ncbi:hypothetical protein Tco_0680841 [Tanacetum coccineum]|uniref:Uncharacterized protein n=1 Tax=Tanacetum coccineum TaxID=301880 RepID=A0ABQ4XMI8_9ASTR